MQVMLKNYYAQMIFLPFLNSSPKDMFIDFEREEGEGTEKGDRNINVRET